MTGFDEHKEHEEKVNRASLYLMMPCLRVVKLGVVRPRSLQTSEPSNSRFL